MTIAVYAGSFDPPTLGHLDIIERASSIFEELEVAVGVNSSKKPLFEAEERLGLIKKAISQRDVLSMRKIRVVQFDGLLVNYCQQVGAKVLVRGLRAATDFDYELGIAQANSTQARDVQTIFFPTNPDYSFVSSSVVKELARHGGTIREFVDPAVEMAVWAKFGRDFRGHPKV